MARKLSDAGPPSDPITFGQWLKGHRLALNLSQYELASRVGCAKSYISALERDESHSANGTPPKPRVDTVDKIAIALGVDPTEPRLMLGYTPVEYSAQQPLVYSDSESNLRMVTSNSSQAEPSETIESLREQARIYRTFADELQQTADRLADISDHLRTA